MNASVSTGIHRLPPELLLEIFSLNCPRDVSDGDLPAYTLMMKRLLVVASVCLQWREIALSAGSLWSFVCVEPLPRTLPRDMEVLAMHLKRSKNALLHLSVSAFVLKEDDWVQVWSILKLGLTRSRTLRLDFPGGRGALLDVPVPNLQSLRVGYYPDPGARVFDNPEHAPNLRHLTLITFHHSILLSIPGSNITSLELFTSLDIPWDALCEFMSRCAALVRFTAEFRIDQTNELNTAISPLTLPRVTYFRTSIPGYMDFFNLPGLQKLGCLGQAVDAKGSRDMFPQLLSVYLGRTRLTRPDNPEDWEPSMMYAHARNLEIRTDKDSITLVLSLLSRSGVASGSSHGQLPHFPLLEVLSIRKCTGSFNGKEHARLVADVLDVRPGLSIACVARQMEELELVLGSEAMARIKGRFVVSSEES